MAENPPQPQANAVKLQPPTQEMQGKKEPINNSRQTTLTSFKPIGSTNTNDNDNNSARSSRNNSPRAKSRNNSVSKSQTSTGTNSGPLRRVGSKLGLANKDKLRTSGDQRPSSRKQRSRKKGLNTAQSGDASNDNNYKDVNNATEITSRDRAIRGSKKVADGYSNSKFIKRRLEEFNHMQLAITTTSRIFKIFGKVDICKLYKHWEDRKIFGNIPSVANIDAFADFFNQMCDETESRHGEMLRNDRRLIERLFYVFDKDQKQHVDLREVAVTVAGLTAGTLEDRLKFCFRAMDNPDNGRLNANELVNLVRAFINHGSNLSIAEGLRQIEQYGTDIVTLRKYLKLEVVTNIKKAVGSTGASLVVTQQDRRNIMVKYGIFTDAKIRTRVLKWMLIGGDTDSITFKTFLQLVALTPGEKFDIGLPVEMKDLSRLIVDYASNCNPYRVDDIMDDDEEDEVQDQGDEDGESVDVFNKKDDSNYNDSKDIDVEGVTDATRSNGSNIRSRAGSLKKTKSPKTIEEKKAKADKRRNEEEEEMEEAIEATRKIRLGICAMDKKSRSRPMKEIMRRLPEKEFEIVIFGNDCLLNDPVEKWPIVDCLIGFYSGGFPLKKAQEYVKLRQPWCCNNLESEYVLRDRRKVYSHLQKNHIAVPPHVFCSRDGYEGAPMPVVIEKEDYIVVNGQKVEKPFVEKPVDGEDHNIYVYYSSKTGGGSKRLFRKVNDRSSKFYADVNNIRMEGSYIYESFLSTGGTDIKVYTCGPSYVHAEARKAPTLDGIVQRDKNGKEVRFPIVLRPFEKLMARKVVLSFGMRFCGFDILKCRNKSYVCDVNGFSFVKTSVKYYEDAATILREMLTRYMGRHLDRRASITELTPLPGFESKEIDETPWGESINLGPNQMVDSKNSYNSAQTGGAQSMGTNSNNNNNSAGESSNIQTNEFNNLGESREKSTSIGNSDPSREELRCVIGVFRHGDRTPKEKLKIKTKNRQWISLHKKFSSSPRDELKLKSSIELQTVVKTAESILLELRKSNAVNGSGSGSNSSDDNNNQDEDGEIVEKEIQSLTNLLRALNRGGSFSGINRKVQIKPLEWKKIKLSNVDEEFSPIPTPDFNSPLLYNRDAKDVALSPVRLPGPAVTEGRGKYSAFTGLLKRDNSTSPKKQDKHTDTGKRQQPQQRLLSASCSTLARETSLNEDGGGGLISPRGTHKINSLEVDGDGNGYDNFSVTVTEEVTKVEVIVKWGGVLTSRGRKQAERLGEWCRNQLYPGENAGLLRLHSTFRHDLKIYSSDEGRVVTTAAAFAKGFLNLEGPLPPIITSLVRSDEHVTALLDDSSAASKHMKEVKKSLHKNMSSKMSVNSLKDVIAPTKSDSVLNAINFLGNINDAIHRLYSLIKSFTASLEHISISLTSNAQLGNSDNVSADVSDHNGIDVIPPPGNNRNRSSSSSNSTKQPHITPIEINIDEWGEEIELIKMRWKKLESDLVKKINKKDGSIKWDISKIPDIYDCIKYDVLHNHAVVLDIKGVPDLYVLAKALADVVIPQEYGCKLPEKIGIGAKISQRLLRKIIADLAASATLGSEFKHETVYRLDSSYMSELNIKSLSRHVRTRLYFTSESHVHAVLNVLRFGAMVDSLVDADWNITNSDEKKNVPLSDEAHKFLSGSAELNYLTHIVIRLYEINEDDDDDDDEEEEEDDEQIVTKQNALDNLDHVSTNGGDDTQVAPINRNEGSLDGDRKVSETEDINNNKDNLDNGDVEDEDLDDDGEELNSNRFRVEISFSSGMSPVPIEAKTLAKTNLEEITLAQNVMHKYRVKVWRDRLDHTLPVEHLVVIQDLTFPEFENMIKGVLSKVKESDMGNAWSHLPSDSTSDREIDSKRSRTPNRRNSRSSKNSNGCGKNDNRLTPQKVQSPGDKPLSF
jgi:Ca2+-binding EF-hand superfamily protein